MPPLSWGREQEPVMVRSGLGCWVWGPRTLPSQPMIVVLRPTPPSYPALAGMSHTILSRRSRLRGTSVRLLVANRSINHESSPCLNQHKGIVYSHPPTHPLVWHDVQQYRSSRLPDVLCIVPTSRASAKTPCLSYVHGIPYNLSRR